MFCREVWSVCRRPAPPSDGDTCFFAVAGKSPTTSLFIYSLAANTYLAAIYIPGMPLASRTHCMQPKLDKSIYIYDRRRQSVIVCSGGLDFGVLAQRHLKRTGDKSSLVSV